MFKCSIAPRRHHVIALFVAAALSHGAAWATPSGNQNLALQKFEQGRSEFQANRYADALVSFQASIDLAPSPNSRLYIARCYRALNKVGSAYASYRLASSEAEDRVRATGEQRYTAARDAAVKEAEEIQSKVPAITLVVPRDAPSDLAIVLDDAPLNRAAWSASLTLDPGSHTLKATGSRMQPFEASLFLGLGQKKVVNVQTVHLATASLRVTWETRPSVFAASLDGKPMAPDALEKAIDVDVGEHAFTVTSPGYKPFVWKQAVTDGQTVNLTVALAADAANDEPLASTPSRGTPKWLFFSAAGTSVVSLAAGTVMYLSANSIVNEQKDKDPLLRSASEKDDADAKLKLSRIFYVAGGVLAAGTVALLFTTSWRPAVHAENASILPWVGPGIGGVSATGTF